MRAADGFGSGQVSVGRIASEKREDFGWGFPYFISDFSEHRLR